MTSPSVDLDGIMPYGVTVSGDGTNRTAKFVTSAKQAKENRLELPGGPVRVSASWSGAEAVRLTLAGVGYPVNIPAGGDSGLGRRSLGRKAGTLSTWNQPTTCHFLLRGAAPSRCTHSHSSNHTGGGLNGHTTGSTGRHFAVCDSLQDGLRGLHGDGTEPARKRRVLHSARRCVPSAAGVHGAGSRRSVVEARRGQRVNNQDVPNPRRQIRRTTQRSTPDHTSERNRPALHYDHSAPQRRRSIYLNRFAAYLPTTSVAAGVVA